MKLVLSADVVLEKAEGMCLFMEVQNMTIRGEEDKTHMGNKQCPPPPQVRYSDEGNLAEMARGTKERGSTCTALCQHGAGPVPAGPEQGVHQGA